MLSLLGSDETMEGTKATRMLDHLHAGTSQVAPKKECNAIGSRLTAEFSDRGLTCQYAGAEAMR